MIYLCVNYFKLLCFEQNAVDVPVSDPNCTKTKKPILIYFIINKKATKIL